MPWESANYKLQTFHLFSGSNGSICILVFQNKLPLGLQPEAPIAALLLKKQTHKQQQKQTNQQTAFSIELMKNEGRKGLKMGHQ